MYPAYARSERIADGTMHALGVVAALAGAISLLIWAGFNLGEGQFAAICVYGIALIATFTASACYHMTPWESPRPTLRRIDHAAIYLKIAGTYTPLVVIVGTGLAYGLLAVVWAVAIWGMIRKLFYWQTPGKYGSVLYLALGWLGAIMIWAAIPVLPVTATALIAAGGLLYSVGVIFFSWDNLKFAMAIWHGFVLAGSACFFGAITLGAVAIV